MRKGKELLERLEHGRQQRFEVACAVDALRHELQAAHLRAGALERNAVAHAGRRFRQEAFHHLGRHDLEHVGGNQTEDPRHAGVRRNRVDAQRHGVEQRAALLGSQELEPQPVRLERQRIDHLGAGHGVLVEVAPRLVEELARQRHVAVVHHVDLADVGHVRHAPAVGRRDDARHQALEHTPDVRKADAHRRRVPALGPGVCS